MQEMHMSGKMLAVFFVDEEATDEEISIALDKANIPLDALCISVRHLS